MAWNRTQPVEPGGQAVRVDPLRAGSEMDFQFVLDSRRPFYIASNTNAVIISSLTRGAP